MTDAPFTDLVPDDALRMLERDELQVVDVRTPGETHAFRIPGSYLAPLDQLPQHVDALDPDAATLVVCAHGIRSVGACAFLAEQGFTRLYNLRGGLSAWTGPLEGASTRPPAGP